ncbi:HoxN/HupN/NixA family nickel/cobalt transporter, partial [Staphylococcus pasteuri]
MFPYTLPFPHPFDPHHIPPIHNTLTKLIQHKRHSLALPFYFSIPHSTLLFLIPLLLGISV